MNDTIKPAALADYPADDLPAGPGDPERSETMFDPNGIFYHGSTGRFLVKDGTGGFRTYARKGPLITGLSRRFIEQGADAKEAKDMARDALGDAEVDRYVEWSGDLAGHRAGPIRAPDGKLLLVTSEPAIPEPESMATPTIDKILAQAFPEEPARSAFMGWLKMRYEAVREGRHRRGQMLVLAGEVQAGKSLVAAMVNWLLGGRSANPYSAWSGGMLWNDDLVGAETLLVDDCVASTDIRSRRAFGARFKESIFPDSIQLRKRNSSSISVRPVWAVIVCTNDTPEALQIIPPVEEDDLSDKITMLRVHPVALPTDGEGKTDEGTIARIIRSELPGLADRVSDFRIPEALRNARTGVAAWRDPELVSSSESTSPARRLEDLLRIALADRGIWHDLPAQLTATEIQSRLMDSGSAVRDQARDLLHWHGACGSALAKLAKMGSRHVSDAGDDAHLKVKKYEINR